MKKEVIVTAKTLEQAIEMGAAQLNMKPEDVTPEVIEMPKKGFFGIGATGYKVKITGRMLNSDIAVAFLEKIIGHMKINAMPKVIEEKEQELKIDIIGENLGTLIGYHGEILDSLQYLTYLVVNKDDDEIDGGDTQDGKLGAVKITLDIENYRKKREETLKSLAGKMADRVLKYSRPITLEPMNSYERRIIHSTIQDITGVTTHSIGQENDRRIVISKEGVPPFRSTFPPKRKPPYTPTSNRPANTDRNFKK